MFAYMIREAIKYRMKELRITQVRVADALDLNKGNLSAFLKGSRPMPLEDIEKICKFLKLQLKPID